MSRSDSELAFWANEASWPDDQRGWVFLARALKKIGGALFGATWTGDELTSGISSSSYPRGASQAARIAVLRAAASAQRTATHSAGSATRFDKVKTEAAKLLADGLLRFGLRNSKGGHVNGPMDRGMWLTKRYSQRFHFCMMNRNDPYSPAVAGESYEYIYILSEDLESYILNMTSSTENLSSSSLPALTMPASPTAFTVKMSSEPASSPNLPGLLHRPFHTAAATLTAPEIIDTFPVLSKLKHRGSPISESVGRAIAACWPAGIPPHLLSKDRDRLIRSKIIELGGTLPASDAALSRDVQRILTNN